MEPNHVLRVKRQERSPHREQNAAPLRVAEGAWLVALFSVLLSWEFRSGLSEACTSDYLHVIIFKAACVVELLANTPEVIMSQYINVSSQHIVHLKRTPCYVSAVSRFKKKEHFLVKRNAQKSSVSETFRKTEQSLQNELLTIPIHQNRCNAYASNSNTL